jgi:hypothetical protein
LGAKVPSFYRLYGTAEFVLIQSDGAPKSCAPFSPIAEKLPLFGRCVGKSAFLTD